MWKLTFVCFGLLGVCAATAAQGQQRSQAGQATGKAKPANYVELQPSAPPAPLPNGLAPVPAGVTAPAEVAQQGSVPQSDVCCGCNARRRSGVWENRIKPCLQESHWGYADMFEETPLGLRVCQAMKAQICNGLADQVVLYRYDFCQSAEGAQLNPHGAHRLLEIVSLMQCFNFHPLVIEPSDDPQLDAARKAYVMGQMAKANFTVPDEWVVVGHPKVPGLAGEEGVMIHSNMLRHTESAAARGMGTAGAGPSFVPFSGIEARQSGASMGGQGGGY